MPLSESETSDFRANIELFSSRHMGSGLWEILVLVKTTEVVFGAYLRTVGEPSLDLVKDLFVSSCAERDNMWWIECFDPRLIK